MEPVTDPIKKALPAPDDLIGVQTIPEQCRRGYEESVIRLGYVLGMPGELVEEDQVERVRAAIRNRGGEVARELLRRACGLGLGFRIWALRNDAVCLNWKLASALQHAFWALGWAEGKPFAAPEKAGRWFRELEFAGSGVLELIETAVTSPSLFDRGQAVNEFLLAAVDALVPVPDSTPREMEFAGLRRFHENPVIIRPHPYNSAPVLKLWERVARGLAHAYSQISEIEGMTVTGSVSTGMADTWSDMNLAIIGRGIPSMAQRRLVLGGVADFNTDILQTPVLDRISINGVLVRIRILSLEAQEARLNPESPGAMAPDTEVLDIGELANSRPVFDRRGIIRRWREKARTIFGDQKELWLEDETVKVREYVNGMNSAAESRDPAGFFMTGAFAAAAMARAVMIKRGLMPERFGPFWAKMRLNKTSNASDPGLAGSRISDLLSCPGGEQTLSAGEFMNVMADLL